MKQTIFKERERDRKREREREREREGQSHQILCIRIIEVMIL
jgi:hypothetical protein